MLHILILAGGKATRMGGDCPKALVPVNGKPIIEHLLANVAEACPRPVIVVGYRGDEIISRLGDAYDYVFQREQLGTAHAVGCAQEMIEKKPGATSILVLFGDHPLVTAKTAIALGTMREKNNAAIALATVHVPNFEGDFALFGDWGRIVHDKDGSLLKIVEVKGMAEDPNRKKDDRGQPQFFLFRPGLALGKLTSYRKRQRQA